MRHSKVIAFLVAGCLFMLVENSLKVPEFQGNLLVAGHNFFCRQKLLDLLMDTSDNSNDATYGRSTYELEQRIRKKFDRFDSNTKFMENFNPELSNREKRKLSRKIQYDGKRNVLYSERGTHLESGRDLCDCLDDSCPGCHFPCTKCRSTKCGHECRQNRKWMYEMIEIEGTKEVVKNKFLSVDVTKEVSRNRLSK